MSMNVFFTIGKHESMILNISDLITFLSIDTHTLDFLIAKEMVLNFLPFFPNKFYLT